MKTNKWLVYCATSPSGKKYVGMTLKTLRERKQGHRYASQNGRLKINLAIKKYGIDNFKWEILRENIPTVEEAEKLETEYIEKLETFNADKGYNLTKGGRYFYGRVPSEKQNKAHSERMKGEGNSFYGKTHTKKTIKLIKKANEGRTGEKHNRFGKTHTNETKKILSEKAKIRGKDPKYKKMRSEVGSKPENLKRLKEIHLKKSKQVQDIYNNVYVSLGEASALLNINKTTISSMANGQCPKKELFKFITMEKYEKFKSKNFTKISKEETSKKLKEIIKDRTGKYNSFYGKKHSKETFKKIHREGEEHNWYGKKHTQKTKKKQSASNWQRKSFKDQNGNTYFSITEAAEKLNIDRNKISTALKNHIEYKGYFFEPIKK